MTVCWRCGNIWGGMNTAHCAACHETFTGITAFDRHRERPTAKKPFGSCQDPADAGLDMADRKYPCWTIPEAKEVDDEG